MKAVMVAIVIFFGACIGLVYLIDHVFGEIGQQYCADAKVRELTFQQCTANKSCVASVDDTVRMERDKRLCAN